MTCYIEEWSRHRLNYTAEAQVQQCTSGGRGRQGKPYSLLWGFHMILLFLLMIHLSTMYLVKRHLPKPPVPGPGYGCRRLSGIAGSFPTSLSSIGLKVVDGMSPTTSLSLNCGEG
ncbi:unnamed protein product [Fusarium venenatum]|uniref:Uncharacterized protein n=1 Tax=Fusarium venenatum TaxID=56646 RepID=A0A2L2TU87_9HYPO|nr:uncharacterized protein FVRRES_10168 [Fusarium venenatum]CEI70091.1 unnamed protein product [Fusarium venenatum]